MVEIYKIHPTINISSFKAANNADWKSRLTESLVMFMVANPSVKLKIVPTAGKDVVVTVDAIDDDNINETDEKKAILDAIATSGLSKEDGEALIKLLKNTTPKDLEGVIEIDLSKAKGNAKVLDMNVIATKDPEFEKKKKLEGMRIILNQLGYTPEQITEKLADGDIEYKEVKDKISEVLFRFIDGGSIAGIKGNSRINADELDTFRLTVEGYRSDYGMISYEEALSAYRDAKSFVNEDRKMRQEINAQVAKAMKVTGDSTYRGVLDGVKDEKAKAALKNYFVNKLKVGDLSIKIKVNCSLVVARLGSLWAISRMDEDTQKKHFDVVNVLVKFDHEPTAANVVKYLRGEPIIDEVKVASAPEKNADEKPAAEKAPVGDAAKKEKPEEAKKRLMSEAMIKAKELAAVASRAGNADEAFGAAENLTAKMTELAEYEAKHSAANGLVDDAKKAIKAEAAKNNGKNGWESVLRAIT